MSASQTGHELVDPAERTTRPHEFLWIWHSAQFSFGVVVLGSVPVSFGLGWWGSATSALVGLLIGTFVFAPLVRFGMRTGATDAVSSAAHFGVRGRVVTNLITLCVAIGFFAIAVWTGATAVVAALRRLVGWGDLVLVVPPVALAVVLVAIFGYRALLTTYKAVTVIGGLVLAGLVAALLPGFDPGAAGEPVLGDFWRTWLLGVTFGVTVPITYATLQGDYSRHLRPGTTDREAVWFTGVGMFLSNAIAVLIGIMASTVITDHSVPWVIGLTDAVPGWFTAFVIVFGFFGTLPQGALCVYAAGLTANSLFRNASRVTCTVAAAAVGVLVLYAGAVVYDAIDSISTFVLFLLLLIAPWSAIMLVGFALRGGRYAPEELLGRGRYWFAGGFDPRAFAAFVPAVAVGFALADNAVYVGPWADLAGGVDLSCVVPFAFAGGGYWLLCKAFPEQPGGTPPARLELSIGNRRGS